MLIFSRFSTKIYPNSFFIFKRQIYIIGRLFKNELKTAVKIFNNRRKTKEHFRDKSTEYNYQEIKNRNKPIINLFDKKEVEELINMRSNFGNINFFRIF